MTVALVEDGRVAIGHVGDSRAYLIREGSLEQLTEDHSLVAELVRSGKLSPEEAEGHPQRSVITRALGTDPDVDVDTFSVETRPGDLFLICSDGLTSMVDDDTILTRGRSATATTSKSAAKALVRAANKRRRRGQHHGRLLRDRRRRRRRAHDRRCRRVEDGADATRTRTRSTSSTGCRAIETTDGRGAAERAAARRPAGGVLAATLVLALLVGASGVVVWGLSRSHFVGAEADGHVAVYQGVPWNVVGDMHLYRTVYVSPLLAAQLSQAERRKLFDHSLRSEDSARAGRAPLRGADRSADERAEPRAREPDRRRNPDGARLRQRLHRAAGGRLDRLALLRRLLLRALPGRAPGRAAAPCPTPTRTCCRWRRC